MKGLANDGQLCYFNAALQCLAFCPNMTNYFLSPSWKADLHPKRKVASAFCAEYAAFVRAYWTEQCDQADAQAVYLAFTRACRAFPAARQHDAHEAMVFFLDKLHDGLCKMKPHGFQAARHPCVNRAAWEQSCSPASVVSEVFMGQIESRISGETYTSTAHDHFTTLSLAVADMTTLLQCIHKFMAPETVTDFRAESSTQTVRVHKQFTYLPRILIIHLKRFDAARKIDRFIDYASELDLGGFCASGCDHHYQLFAVCLHRGDTEGGHYSACAEARNRWFFMDDAHVETMKDINYIIQKDAYVLLYKRL